MKFKILIAAFAFVFIIIISPTIYAFDTVVVQLLTNWRTGDGKNRAFAAEESWFFTFQSTLWKSFRKQEMMPILHFNQVLFFHFHRREKRTGRKSVALRSTEYWQATNFSHYQWRMREITKNLQKRFEMIFEVKRAADAHDKLKKSQSYYW